MKLFPMLALPLSIIVLAGCGGGGDAGSSPSGAKLRAVVADYQLASPVDVTWGDYQFVKDVPAGYLSGYANVNPGTATVNFVNDAASAVVAQSANESIGAGDFYSTVLWRSDTGPKALLLKDEPGTELGKGKVRLAHTAANLGSVDVYIVPAATDIRGLSPSFSGVRPGAATPYVSFTPQYVDLVVTAAGSKTIQFAYGVQVEDSSTVSVLVTRNQAANLWAMVLNDVK